MLNPCNSERKCSWRQQYSFVLLLTKAGNQILNMFHKFSYHELQKSYVQDFTSTHQAEIQTCCCFGSRCTAIRVYQNTQEMQFQHK